MALDKQAFLEVRSDGEFFQFYCRQLATEEHLLE